MRFRLRLSVVCTLFLVATFAAQADERFDGNWRGTAATPGRGDGPVVSILTMRVTPIPLRSPTEHQQYDVALHLVRSNDLRVRRAPEPPITYPPGDRRPGVVTGPVPTIDIVGRGQVLSDEDGPFFLIRARQGRDCGIAISITQHADVAGPHGEAVYYQLIPARYPCSGGPFDGIVLTFGWLSR